GGDTRRAARPAGGRDRRRDRRPGARALPARIGRMSRLLELAVAIAREAGGVARARFHEPRTIRTKTSEIDRVTAVDQALDRLIRERIRAERAHDALLTEESQAESGSSGVRWIVDPLDGTTNYAHAFPHFAISIGVEVDGRRACGVVYDPMRDELF